MIFSVSRLYTRLVNGYSRQPDTSGSLQQMNLSDYAGRLLGQLCTVEDAFLFAARDGGTSFSLVTDLDCVSVPREVVDELWNAGYLDTEIIEDGEWTLFTCSEKGRSKFRSCR